MNKPKARRVTAGIYRASNDTRKTDPSISECVLVPHRKRTPNKSVLVRTSHFKGYSAKDDLIRRMNLDEMLEASKVVQMGIIGEELPIAISPNARKYAGAVLALNKGKSTKPQAVRLIDDLNAQIIRTNKRTTNAEEAKRLYRNLMREN